MKPNAFLEPNNPQAVFPQHAKPHILDMRCHKIAGSGFTSSGVGRKVLSGKTKKGKFAGSCQTTEELEIERIQ
jgi:hypothetical protein